MEASCSYLVKLGPPSGVPCSFWEMCILSAFTCHILRYQASVEGEYASALNPIFHSKLFEPKLCYMVASQNRGTPI